MSTDGRRPDGTVAGRAEVTAREPAAVVVLEGVTSTRPELADLIDLAVLVEVPIAVQHGRIAARRGTPLSDTPFAKWESAEQYYRNRVRPAASFDLVVTTADESDLTVP